MHEGSASPLPRAARRRVLLVDDDPDWRDALRAHLEALDFEVEEAADGSTALRCLAAAQFDLILLDLMMPGLSGEAVARELGEDGPPVVFVTGADSGALASAMQTGARYYLPKSVNRPQLELLLQALLPH